MTHDEILYMKRGDVSCVSRHIRLSALRSARSGRLILGDVLSTAERSCQSVRLSVSPIGECALCPYDEDEFSLL